MIKVEVVNTEDLTEIHFVARNDSEDLLSQLDSIYQRLVSESHLSPSKTDLVYSGYVSSTHFKLVYKKDVQTAEAG